MRLRRCCSLRCLNRGSLRRSEHALKHREDNRDSDRAGCDGKVLHGWRLTIRWPAHNQAPARLELRLVERWVRCVIARRFTADQAPALVLNAQIKPTSAMPHAAPPPHSPTT